MTSYKPTGKPLSEAELMKFKWWYEMYQAKTISMWELQTRFGRKVKGGLVKPMSREGVSKRLESLYERGLMLFEMVDEETNKRIGESLKSYKEGKFEVVDPSKPGELERVTGIGVDKNAN